MNKKLIYVNCYVNITLHSVILWLIKIVYSTNDYLSNVTSFLSFFSIAVIVIFWKQQNWQRQIKKTPTNPTWRYQHPTASHPLPKREPGHSVNKKLLMLLRIVGCASYFHSTRRLKKTDFIITLTITGTKIQHWEGERIFKGRSNALERLHR